MQSCGFHVNQAKFVQERLSHIVIPRGSRSDKKSETTEGEKRQLRAVWGSVNSVQRETRPDVSALAAHHSTVQDFCDANMAVDRLKSEPFLGVKLPHKNRTFPWSQASTHSHSPSALGYRSGRILGKRRRVSQSRSFLGWCNFPRTVEQRSISLCFVESQVSLLETKVFKNVGCRNSDHVRGLGKGRVDSWRTEESTNPNFSIVEWAARSRNRGLLIAARSSDAEVRLPKVLSIGDAKSLYDHLRTETSGGANDRRTAIDIHIIRASMVAPCASGCVFCVLVFCGGRLAHHFELSEPSHCAKL